MGMTVSRKKDTSVAKVFVHRIADVRGGVSVSTSDLGGDYLLEGAVVSAPVNGICHVVKTAVLTAAVGASDKEINVKKGHQFVAGDIVMAAENGVATTIASIDKSGKTYDTITLKAALGELAIGAGIAQAEKEQTTSGAALKYTPFAVVGTGKEVFANDNLNTDAWLIGVTSGNSLPTFVEEKLKGIINY